MIISFQQYINESKKSSSLFEKILWDINNKDSRHLKKILKKSKHYKKILFPTLLAEESTGITNISHTYKMPYGLNESELKTLIKECEKDNVDFLKSRLYKDMMYLNQDSINGLELIKGNDRIVVLKGMVNRIPAKDILDYCSNKTKVVKTKENKYKVDRKTNHSEYSELYNHLSKKGIVLEYYPSLKSLRKIVNFLELKK
jgi:hypothetical protein